MKKISIVALLVVALCVLASCVSVAPKAEEPKVSDVVLTPDILEHKGTALGANVPNWTMTYIESGASGVEKLAEFKGKYVIVLDEEGESRQGTQLAMDNMNAPVQIASYLSTRVQQKFAGAQVGDRNELSEYFESVTKKVSEATFSGFQQGPDWWVFLQYYKPGAKNKNSDNVEKRIYRVIKIYSIDNDILKAQLDKYLNDSATETVKTPEQKRAVDAVQAAFYEGF